MPVTRTSIRPTPPPASAHGRPGPHVALFLPGFHGGGAERITIELAVELGRRGLEVDLVVGSRTGPLSDTVPETVEVVDLGAPRTRRAIAPLVRYLRDRRPDVLLPSIAHADMACLVAGRIARTGTLVVPRVSNTLSRTHPGLGAPVPRAARELLLALYRRAPLVVACSQGMADDLVTYGRLDPERVRVIANAAVGTRLHELAAMPVDHPWFTDEVPTLMSVASLTRQKNLPLLLDAFARFRARRAARLFVLGEGPLLEGLEAQADRLGIGKDVEFAGFDPNPFRYLARTDLFVLSSDWEGLPGVLIEAVACGANVVSTDCPSGPREILDGGRFGRLVPTGDVAALASAMEVALDDPIVPPEEAWTRYTAGASADAYAALVEELVGVGHSTETRA